MSARVARVATAHPNVVGFTDTREMLKPFHALKYLADNFLEEYNFFFLASDVAYVNARRLSEIVGKLSVSQDVYMGTVLNDDDSHYCSLDAGIIMSNSVLRAVHSQLDWCVRNSYSPHHHENIGRCVLHAAHTACQSTLQGQNYTSVPLSQFPSPTEHTESGLTPALADAVTAWPVDRDERIYEIHAYVSRVYLERGTADIAYLASEIAALSHSRRSWPELRREPGYVVLPQNRFDHLRWTWFNATHAMLPDDRHAVAEIKGAHREALDLVIKAVWAWCGRHIAGATSVALVEGARLWTPATDITYTLLVRVTRDDETQTLHKIQAVRPIGASRLVPVPYVTESARVTVVLHCGIRECDARKVTEFLTRYEAITAGGDKKTSLVLALPMSLTSEPHLRTYINSLQTRRDITERTSNLAQISLGLNALLLFVPPAFEFNDDFLNRVRMNTIKEVQWFSPIAFSKYSITRLPQFSERTNTGRFHIGGQVLSVYGADLENAMSTCGPPEPNQSDTEHISACLSRSNLHCLQAPEPAAILLAHSNPCEDKMCYKNLEETHFDTLELGAKHSLAKLILEAQDANVSQ